MRPNLDSLAEEIQQHLEAEHFIIFHSMSRVMEDGPLVHWDTTRQADYRRFLECALQLGVRLIHFHSREFRAQHREEALGLLEEAEVARDDKRALERRIKELAIYEGFTCAIELSFDFEGRVYVFEVQTEWYDEWHDILDELEDAAPDEPEDGAGYGGFYSNN
ncbi:MAG: hypothetical protein HY858_14710 [Candidatus Solibacter usitatus]|nr:hypothetical protein [Candidatus Solibacter usitatus]